MKKILILMVAFCSFMFAKNLIVLEPAVVEILYALNAQENIVGVSKMMHSSTYPQEQTSKLTSVGNYSKPNIEKIISLNPDMVIVNRYSANLKDDLKKFNIKTATYEANSLEDIYKNIISIGQIVNKNNEAKELVKNLKQTLSKLDTKKFVGKKAIFFYSSAPLMAFNSKTLPGDILKVLGFVNLSDGIEGERPIISQEFILQKNPDYIFALNGMLNVSDILKVNPLLQKTTAGEKKAIYFVQSSDYLRGSQRVFVQIQKLYDMLNK